MGDKPLESITLARLRTLLALERNYLAEERTLLAEFRTGLALVIIGPPTSFVSLQSIWIEWVNYLIFIFFSIITIIGIIIIFNTRRKLKLIRKNKFNINRKKQEILAENPEAQHLLVDCIDPFFDDLQDKDNQSPLSSKYE